MANDEGGTSRTIKSKRTEHLQKDARRKENEFDETKYEEPELEHMFNHMIEARQGLRSVTIDA